MTKRWCHIWNKCIVLCHLTVFSMYMIFYVWKLYREQLHICLFVLINNKGELFLDDVASPEFTQVKTIVTQFSKFQRPPFISNCDIKYLQAREKGLRIFQLEVICPTVVRYRTLEHFYHSIVIAWWKGNNFKISKWSWFQVNTPFLLDPPPPNIDLVCG